MTKKIFRSIFIVALAVLLACFVFIFGVLYEYFSSVQRDQLEAETALAAQGVSLNGMAYFEDLTVSGYRLTWIAPDGTVLYDNRADASTMENHAEREEIQEALETGSGDSERYSATLAEKTFYHAQLLTDGTVIRVSTTQYSLWSLVLGMLQPIIIVLVFAILFSFWLAHRVSRRIMAPFNRLNLEQPLENETYEEISPLLTRIERQQRQIKSQMEELARKRDEFSVITGAMGEGLILLNEQSIILSINRAAARLFNTDQSCVGHDILTVVRSLAMQELIQSAQSGERDETIVELKGGVYQITANPVYSGGKVRGVVILTFEATEKAQAERQRREFSANVSHELKTPLQSIMGAAELMENGLVKPEDLPRFFGHIRSETSRLVTLIDDIIRLSQLDEGSDLPKEKADLFDIALEVEKSLSSQAETHHITLAVQGEHVTMMGVRRLLYEIIYNLCDNAIKYNHEDGFVTVTVAKDAEEVKLTVADTGIGIPPEHQKRVFERFYRVDKSHSKETGGTGLGLSIVKHAAQYHNATLSLQSEPGKGTEITVHFPLG